MSQRGRLLKLPKTMTHYSKTGELHRKVVSSKEQKVVVYHPILFSASLLLPFPSSILLI